MYYNLLSLWYKRNYVKFEQAYVLAKKYWWVYKGIFTDPNQSAKTNRWKWYFPMKVREL